MLKITGEGRKAALDMRLVDPDAEPQQETKIDRAVSRIVKIWKATQNERSTQLVFSDLSTPDPERFNVYDDVRSKLVKAGVPAAEIAFIHDAETDTAKKLLFDACERRAGCGYCSDRPRRWAPARMFSDGSWRSITWMRPGDRAISSSGKAGSCARATRIKRFRSSATSPKGPSTPTCGRRSKPRPASSSR